MQALIKTQGQMTSSDELKHGDVFRRIMRWCEMCQRSTVLVDRYQDGITGKLSGSFLEII